MPIIGASTWAAHEAYIASHSINDLFSDALTAVLQAQPHDPAAYLAGHFTALEQQHGRAELAEEHKKDEVVRLLRRAAQHAEDLTGHGDQATLQAEEIRRLGNQLAEADMWSSEKSRSQKEDQKHKKADSFVEHAQKWAASAEATLPKDLRLQIVTGAVEQIAPRLIEQNHMQMQLNELEGQQARIDERTSELDRKVIAHNIGKLSKAHD